MPVPNPITTEKVDRVGIIIRRGRETVYGTPSGTLRAIAKISETFRTAPEKITSEESFPDRMQGQVKLVGRAANGQVSVYLRFNETCFEYLEEAFWSRFDEVHDLASDQVSFAAADNSVNIDEPIHPAVFDGAGLDDLTASGTYSGAVTKTFEIEIDANGTPDTFQWREIAKDGTLGTLTAGVAITGAAQVLADGVEVTFAATTGHTIGDKWTVAVKVFDADDFGAYRTFLVAGSVAANNILWRIADDPANTTTKLVLEWGTVTTAAAGAAVTLTGTTMLAPGRVRHSVTYEREYPDGTFIPYTGQVAGEVRMQANMKQFIRLDLTYTGRGTDTREVASAAGSHLDAHDGEIADMQNNLTAFRENDAVDGNIRNLELTWNNQARYQELSMQDAPVGVAPGTVQMTGTLSGLLFHGDDRLDRAMADTASSLSAVVETDEGYLVLQFLRFKFEPQEPTAEGGEGDAELNLPFQAEPFKLPDGTRCYILATRIAKPAP